MTQADGEKRASINESAAQEGGASQPLKTIPRASPQLEPEADAGGGGPVVAVDIAVGEAAIRCRVEGTDIGIPLGQEPPVENRGDSVEVAFATRVGGRHR